MNTRNFLLTVLQNHLHTQPTAPCEGINWVELQSLSRSQQVEGIVYFQCRRFMPPDVKANFGNAFTANALSQRNEDLRQWGLIK